jgi:hypothetical protein
MLAEVAHSVPTGEGGRGGRNERLAAVAAGSDPGGSVDVGTHIALLGQVRRPGVNPHAHADRGR